MQVQKNHNKELLTKVAKYVSEVCVNKIHVYAFQLCEQTYLF